MHRMRLVGVLAVKFLVGSLPFTAFRHKRLSAPRFLLHNSSIIWLRKVPKETLAITFRAKIICLLHRCLFSVNSLIEGNHTQLMIRCIKRPSNSINLHPTSRPTHQECHQRLKVWLRLQSLRRVGLEYFLLHPTEISRPLLASLVMETKSSVRNQSGRSPVAVCRRVQVRVGFMAMRRSFHYES